MFTRPKHEMEKSVSGVKHGFKSLDNQKSY